MAFLDRLFGKKEEKTKEARVQLKDVEEFAESKMKKAFEPLKKPMREDYKNLQQLSKILLNQLKLLEQSTYPENTYPALINKAVGNRKSFVDKMRFVSIQITKPMGSEMEDMIRFCDETDKLINAANLETTKEYAFLKILFDKEGKEVVQTFKQIMDTGKRMSDMVRPTEESNSKLLRIREIAPELSNLSYQLKKNEVGYLDSKLKEDERLINDFEAELRDIASGSDWKAVLAMQSVADQLRNILQSKKSEFMYQISKLEVPIKKYRRSVESRVLDEYIQKSIEQIMCDDPKGKTLMAALKSIRDELKSGRMNLKNSDEFSVLVENAIENNIIGRIIEDYSRTFADLKAQEEKISSQETLKRKMVLEQEVKRLRSMIDGTGGHKKATEDRCKKMQTNLDQKANEMQTLLQEIAKEKVLLDV